MVQLTRIYTRGGDKGKTSLSTGKRVMKHDLRVSAYGEVDEANAIIGLARQHTQGEDEIDALLASVQNDLFDLGADLATPDTEAPKFPPLRIQASQVTALEEAIDRYNAELQPLKSFILPGGSAASAWLHLGRTVVRRAERAMTALAEEESVNPDAVRYANRLSDLLFVLARTMNAKGEADVLWVPAKNQ